MGRVSICEIIMSLIDVSLIRVAKIFLHFSHALSCEFLAVLGMRDHTDETVLIVVVLDNTLRILAVPNMLDHTGETVDVICLSEVWLNPSTTKLINISNYRMFSKLRCDRVGGGVSILL